MERIDDECAVYWDSLHAQLAARLAPLTLSLFRDLPSLQARTIAALVDGGKRLRAAVVLAVCDALGGRLEDALPSAAAVECVHAASLVHDDLVDGDRIRRDRPATWVVLGARRAILLADVIFATALQRSAELGRHEVATLARGISMLAVGAYGEPLRPRDIEAGDTGALYERTIRLKTGSLFAAAAELGAIAAGSKRGLRCAAAEFGRRIGEAYQIADDRSDVVVRAGPLTAEQTATLANLLAYFDGARKPPPSAKPVARAAPNIIGFDAMRVAAAMEAEIDRRLELACDALALFPPGPRLALLRRIPRAIVHLAMAAAFCRGPMGSPWSRRPCAEAPTR